MSAHTYAHTSTCSCTHNTCTLQKVIYYPHSNKNHSIWREWISCILFPQPITESKGREERFAFLEERFAFHETKAGSNFCNLFVAWSISALFSRCFGHRLQQWLTSLSPSLWTAFRDAKLHKRALFSLHSSNHSNMMFCCVLIKVNRRKKEAKEEEACCC